MRKPVFATVALGMLSVAALAAKPKPVTVPLQDASGSNVGSVTFLQKGKAVEMKAMLQGMPTGQHAVHVHAVGTCTPPDFASAGGHLNPAGKHHGYANPDGHHAGDFPASVMVNADGSGTAKLKNADISLDPASPVAIYGKSVVVHELVDDQKTDPAGASGKRLACGVIPAAM